MRANELFNLSFDEKVYALEVYHDNATDLVAVGLKNSIIIYQIHVASDDDIQQTVVQAINHDSTVHAMAWSPDTKFSVAPRFFRLATSGSDHNLRIFASDSSGQNGNLRVLKGHRDYINCIAFHPVEGEPQIVSGSDDHTLALWDSNSGQRLQRMTFDHPVMSVMWHPEEISKLMIAEKNGTLHIFNIASCKPILSLHCAAEPLLTADWSISNSLLISAAVRSEVILFDLSKMSAVSRRKTSADVIKTLKMSPFSDYLIATSAQPNYSVEVLNLRTNQTIGVLQKEPVTGLAWFKKRQILLVANNERVTAYQMSNKQI